MTEQPAKGSGSEGKWSIGGRRLVHFKDCLLWLEYLPAKPERRDIAARAGLSFRGTMVDSVAAVLRWTGEDVRP
jgi:hypothetical protein